jgi:hypothetical protein
MSRDHVDRGRSRHGGVPIRMLPRPTTPTSHGRARVGAGGSWLLAECLVPRGHGNGLRPQQQTPCPDVFGRQDPQAHEDQRPSREDRQKQSRDTDYEHGDSDDSDGDPFAAASDEPADELEREEECVVMPRGLIGAGQLGDGGIGVAFLGVVPPGLVSVSHEVQQVSHDTGCEVNDPAVGDPATSSDPGRGPASGPSDAGWGSTARSRLRRTGWAPACRHRLAEIEHRALFRRLITHR